MEHSVKRLSFLGGLSLHPQFSPDGMTVIFSSRVNRRTDIYAVNSDGSGLRQLTAGDGHFDSAVCSPDGSRIAFVRSDSMYEEIRDIWIMDADGANPMALTTTCAESHPQFSPDGNWITFVSGRDKSLEIYRMRADGSDQQRLTFAEDQAAKRVGPPATNMSPRFLPDGSGIVFASNYLLPDERPEYQGRFSIRGRQISWMNGDGNYLKPLVTTVRWCGDPIVSPTGNWVAFASGASAGYGLSLCLISPDGSAFHILEGSAGDYHAFHPSGNSIVFASNQDRRAAKVTDNNDIYCIRIDGGNLERLTDNEVHDTLPAFSPDGKQMVFCSKRDGPLEIYSMAYSH